MEQEAKRKEDEVPMIISWIPEEEKEEEEEENKKEEVEQQTWKRKIFWLRVKKILCFF